MSKSVLLSHTSDSLAQAYRNACLAELEALKPGNVHIFADGHGMQVQDFIHSAEASARWIAAPDLSLGERIFSAIEATHTAVSCNTNLGIVMLCAPIIQAVLLADDLPLQAKLEKVIAETSQQDAEWLFKAIRLAKPAGIGRREAHDVAQPAQITLLQAMQLAQDDDLIAQQYASNFSRVILEAVPIYLDLLKRWERPAWATTAVYLFWLSHYPDSHIVRKYGKETAEAVLQQANSHYNTLIQLDNPKTYLPTLLTWDASLKAQAINPGTSADLTVATILWVSMHNQTC